MEQGSRRLSSGGYANLHAISKVVAVNGGDGARFWRVYSPAFNARDSLCCDMLPGIVVDPRGFPLSVAQASLLVASEK